MAKIYISSSFVDLREERRAVADAIIGRGHVAVGMETYRATDEPAIEFCIADVKRCDIYIGVFAFRYGSVLSGESKCITELEYEAAGKAGLKRFIFLLRDDAPWPVDRTDSDRTRILELRKLLCAQHMVKYFANAQELAAFVRDVIDYDVAKPARDIPDDLPYRCDRAIQELELDKLFELRRQVEAPTGFIIHGDELQGHDMYCQRLRERILPRYLGSDGLESQIKSYRLNWPPGVSDGNDARRLLLRDLGERTLRRPNASESEIQGFLARIPAPVLIYAYCRGDDWERDGAITAKAFLDLWKGWPLGPAQQLVVALFIRHRRQGQKLVERVRFWKSGSRLQDFLKAVSGVSNGSFRVLPRLHDITQQEAEDWANEEEVNLYRAAPNIVGEIRRVYDRWRARNGTDAIPIDELAPMLREALERADAGEDRAA